MLETGEDMKTSTLLSTLSAVLYGALSGPSAVADVIIPYNEYSESPTIARGNGTSTDPRNPGYGAMRIFIEKVTDYTDDQGPDALPAGQKVVFQRNQDTGRHVNALRGGIQFANANATPRPSVSDPSWGFIYNSMPFGINFEQTLGYLYGAKVDPAGKNGLELAQAVLDARGGTQFVFPVVGSTMQGSGYFPQPIGKADCNAGDTDCEAMANGIGLAGLCTSGWRIRYLAPPQDIVDRACDIAVKRGTVRSKTLQFYPPVGGQSVLLPLQRRTIQGFEYVNPYDDLVDFFPVKNATPAKPLGEPDAGNLDCGPPLAFPIPAGTQSSCTQNAGQAGARFVHHPSWHQPFLLAWLHIDKTVWNGLNAPQRAAILRAAKESVVESYNAAESVQCLKLKDMLDFNNGINQRNADGTLRLVDGKPVNADITLARWPDDALKVLREARDDYLASLTGPANPNDKTDAQKDFSVILTAWTQHAASIGAADKFDPGTFPAKTGLVAGATCSLVR
jgi:TRAP-type mannitol/chloroaromatic compound transport system substrate-binding protein